MSRLYDTVLWLNYHPTKETKKKLHLDAFAINMSIPAKMIVDHSVRVYSNTTYRPTQQGK